MTKTKEGNKDLSFEPIKPSKYDDMSEEPIKHAVASEDEKTDTDRGYT